MGVSLSGTNRDTHSKNKRVKHDWHDQMKHANMHALASFLF